MSDFRYPKTTVFLGTYNYYLSRKTESNTTQAYSGDNKKHCL